MSEENILKGTRVFLCVRLIKVSIPKKSGNFIECTSYFTPLRKTVRWYHKIGFEFLLNTAVVNALIIYNEIRGNQKTQIAKFRHDHIYSLAEMKHLQDKNVPQATRSSRSSAVSTLPHHHLEKYSGIARIA